MKLTPDDKMTVELNQFYQHVDGGLYLTKQIATSSNDLSQHVVYDHIWPFEQKTWIRDISEWTPERFSLLTYPQATAIALGDKEAGQVRITAAKQARKAAKQT